MNTNLLQSENFYYTTTQPFVNCAGVLDDLEALVIVLKIWK